MNKILPRTSSSPGTHKVAWIIARRDQIDFDAALEQVEDCQAEIRLMLNDATDLSAFKDLILDSLGLEPDYLDDLLFQQI